MQIQYIPITCVSLSGWQSSTCPPDSIDPPHNIASVCDFDEGPGLLLLLLLLFLAQWLVVLEQEHMTRWIQEMYIL
jgi:hypothetical protein